jgi:alkylhydroperoxidase family enzyme
LRIGLWISRRITGRDLLPGRLLAWYPKAAVGSGIMEALVAHADGKLDKRILKLVRLQVSFALACPFCIDMNAYDFDQFGITGEELAVLQSRQDVAAVQTFPTGRKSPGIRRAHCRIASVFSGRLREAIESRVRRAEIVILAATAAQVNYWARLLQALGVPPAGFRDTCPVRSW